jgi:hypothetical protein
MLANLARGLSGSLAASALVVGTLAVTSQTAPLPAPAMRPVAETALRTVGAQYIANSAFTSGVTGWSSAGRLATSSVGLNGSPAAVLTSDQLQMVTLSTNPRPVSATAAGDVYQASASVRSTRVNQRAAIVVREVAPGKTPVIHRTPLTLPDVNWHRITVQVPVAAPGSSLLVQVQAAGQKVGDRFTVDDVTLTLEKDGTLPPPCTFSQRGIPSSECGALLGAAYNSNTDPTAWEAEMGGPLGVRRTYWSPTQVASAVNVAKTDLAAHRIPWISFKLPHTWAEMAAGKGDVWARDLATRLAQLNGPVWVAFHHEPEGDGNIADWKAMQEHLAPIVRSTAPNVAYTAILMGWYQISGDTRYSLANVWPNTKIDIAGFDPYNWYGTLKSTGVIDTKQVDMKTTYFDPISAWAASKGLAWAVAETGYTDSAHQVDPTWIQRTLDGLEADNGIAMTYFNSSLNSDATWTWVLGPAKKAAFAATLAGTPRLP